jgi:hypothetical protein
MKHKFLSAGLACLALGIAAPAAMADTIVTENYSFPAGPTTYSDTINVAQYAPAAGLTLQSISFIINATMVGAGSASDPNSTGSLNFYKQSAQDGEVTATLANNTVLNDVLPTVYPTSQNIVVTHSTPFTFSGITGSASQTSVFNGSSTTDADGHTISGAGLLGQFLGSGTVPVSLTGTSLTAYVLDTGLSDTSSDAVNGTLQVVFDFIPSVPDSGSWAAEALMFGALVIGTGRSVWRKSPPVS